MNIAAVGNLADEAERSNRPKGRFIEVDGVRLHYVEHGSGVPVVLLHGNGSMLEGFGSSGLIDLAAKDFRVIASIGPASVTVCGRAAPCGRRSNKRSS